MHGGALDEDDYLQFWSLAGLRRNVTDADPVPARLPLGIMLTPATSADQLCVMLPPCSPTVIAI